MTMTTSVQKVNLAKRRETASGRVVKLTHIPNGFFDVEVYQYFEQFGRIKRVRVPRSKKGHFINLAYIYFCDAEAARVAAETMNNYLMFDKRVRSYLLTEKIPATILAGPRLIRNHPVGNRVKRQLAKKMCEKKDDEEQAAFKEKLAQSLEKSMNRLKKAGYDYEFEYQHKM